MWVAFALQKLLNFFSTNINAFENILATIFNGFVIIELVKLEQLGPEC